MQGVGFRWSARSVAQRLGVTGFARNLADDTVEVEAEGAAEAVDEFLAWLHDGPPSSAVSGVDVSAVEPAGSESFEVG